LRTDDDEIGKTAVAHDALGRPHAEPARRKPARPRRLLGKRRRDRRTRLIEAVLGLQFGDIVVGKDRRDLLEEPGRQRLVELRANVALVEAQQGGIDMGGKLTPRGKGRGKRRHIAFAPGQGQIDPANHRCPLPAMGISPRAATARRMAGCPAGLRLEA